MALLTKEEREKRFKYLGLGEYNKDNILKFQKMAFPKNTKQQDSVYGTNTDNALRHFYNVKKCAPSFFPEEFKCECGGKYCTGYPSYMKQVELKHIQAIRDHYKKPMKVTCGLRCKTYNSKLSGSITNSLHLVGRATDFYMAGVTDTLANRKKSIKYIKTLPNHHYTYGNGINSDGYAVYAPYMGNAMHTDVNKAVITKKVKVTPQDKICTWAKKIAADNTYHYVKYSLGSKAHECPVCHNHAVGTYHGWNCIGYAFACWHHGGGIKCKCSCDVFTDQIYNKMLTMAYKDAKALAAQRMGLSESEFVLKRKKGKPLDTSTLKKGDIVVYYTSDGYKHTALWIGDGKIADCTSGRTDQIKYGAKSYTGMTIKLAFRYRGK